MTAPVGVDGPDLGPNPAFPYEGGAGSSTFPTRSSYSVDAPDGGAGLLGFSLHSSYSADLSYCQWQSRNDDAFAPPTAVPSMGFSSVTYSSAAGQDIPPKPLPTLAAPAPDHGNDIFNGLDNNENFFTDLYPIPDDIDVDCLLDYSGCCRKCNRALCDRSHDCLGVADS